MWVVPVVAFAGCLVLDALAGRWHRRGRLARPHVTLARSGRPQQVIVAFPGYTMAGHLLSAAFAPCLGEDDAMIVVQYAERGIDVEQIYQAVMVEVARIGAPRLRVYGGSMGACVPSTSWTGTTARAPPAARLSYSWTPPRPTPQT